MDTVDFNKYHRFHNVHLEDTPIKVAEALSKKIQSLIQSTPLREPLAPKREKIKSVFIKEAQIRQYHEEVVARCVEVGEKLGGVRTLNVKGMNFVVPLDPLQVATEHESAKSEIASRIHIDETREHMQESRRWENTSRTVDELVFDAEQVKVPFMLFLEKVADDSEGELCLKIDNPHIIKERVSLERKVTDDLKLVDLPKEAVVRKIGDALRNSVIVRTPEDITHFVQGLQQACLEKHWDVSFKNIWDEKSRPNGYVGVHARIRIVEEGKVVLAELQIHLPEIYDGTVCCAKEEAHRVYEYDRMAYGPDRTGRKIMSPSFTNPTGMLIYLSHMKKILEPKEEA